MAKYVTMHVRKADTSLSVYKLTSVRRIGAAQNKRTKGDPDIRNEGVDFLPL